MSDQCQASDRHHVPQYRGSCRRPAARLNCSAGHRSSRYQLTHGLYDIVGQNDNAFPTLLHFLQKTKTKSQLNDLFKYADDTTLLIPEHTDTDIGVEFSHIKAWASANHLSLNLVFRRPRARSLYLPPAVDNNEQLNKRSADYTCSLVIDYNSYAVVFVATVIRWK